MSIAPKIEILSMRKFAAKLLWSPQGHHITLSPPPGLFPLNLNQDLAAEIDVENTEAGCDSELLRAEGNSSTWFGWQCSGCWCPGLEHHILPSPMGGVLWVCFYTAHKFLYI